MSAATLGLALLDFVQALPLVGEPETVRRVDLTHAARGRELFTEHCVAKRSTARACGPAALNPLGLGAILHPPKAYCNILGGHLKAGH